MKLTDDKDAKMRMDVYNKGAAISLSMNKDRVVGNFPELGLCDHCTNLQGVVTEFGSKGAACSRSMAKLTGKCRIRGCSSFWDKTYMGLQSLLDMNPPLIDPKEPVGF